MFVYKIYDVEIPAWGAIEKIYKLYVFVNWKTSITTYTHKKKEKFSVSYN